MSKVRVGDFVLSGIDARNGAFGIVPDELDNAIISNDFWCLVPNEKIIKKEFLLFITSTPYFDFICNQSSDGTTQRIRLQKDKFFNYEIAVPPIEEQDKILRKLTIKKVVSEELESEHSTQLDLLKKLRQQILQHAFQGKLVSQDPNDELASKLLERIKTEKKQLIREKKIKKDKQLPEIKPEEIPFGIPENWVWCRLGQGIRYSDNINIENEFPADTLINYVDIDAVDNQRFVIRESKLKTVSELSSRARRVLSKGFIVYSLVRPYLNNIAIIDEDKENFIGSTGFVVFTGISIENRYLKFYLLSDYTKRVFLKFLSGFNSPSITHEQFNSILLPLPPLSEQYSIITKIEYLMRLCDELEQSIQQNQKFTQELLQVTLKEALEPTHIEEHN